MKTMVYAYGCKPIKPVKDSDGNIIRNDGDLIGAQISAAHAYYNRLIDLRTEYRTRRDALIRAVCPEYEAAHAAVDAANVAVEAIVEEIRLANAVARRKRATPEEAQRLKVARCELKAAREQRKTVRKAVLSNAALQIRLAALDVEFNGVPIPDTDRRKGGLFKDARAACGCYWGTYLRQEQAIEQAQKRIKGPLKSRRWTGDGAIAVQVQGGASWQELTLGKGKVGSLCQLVSITPRGKHKAPVAAFRLCVDTDDKRKPIWVAVNAYWHRPLPPDAKIMGISLVRAALPPHRMSDGSWQAQFKWELQFTLRTCEEKTHASAGECGIDLGWRLMADGSLRVAYLADSTGHHEQFCLPARLLSRFAKSDEIQGVRDDNFNCMVARLREWTASNPVAPDWLRTELISAHLWKRKARLINVLNLWRDRVFQGDDEIYQALLDWRAQDTHLWQWEFCNRRKAERIRKGIYRKFAAEIRQRYATVIVEDCDWRQLARKTDAGSNEQDRSKRYMKIASIGMLRQLLVADGAIPDNAKDTTRTCSVCGVVEDWDQAAELVHTCVNGHTFDQDHTGSRNLLARASVLKAGLSVDPPQDSDGSADTSTWPNSTSRSSESLSGEEVTVSGNGYSNRWKKRKEDRSRKAAEKASKAASER